MMWVLNVAVIMNKASRLRMFLLYTLAMGTCMAEHSFVSLCASGHEHNFLILPFPSLSYAYRGREDLCSGAEWAEACGRMSRGEWRTVDAFKASLGVKYADVLLW
ncbi:hypothetical protein E2C01_092159 [Portunus trituberculatus]|uniref:Secreted protein n=1 Tax=Portunus trituberculatus TaxID=210409 RepID=A0A5B7JPV4_PORTR|nr:hypothetical protein [Portunus trituberculatus]